MIYANKYDYVFLIACNVCIYQFILVLQPYRPLIACKWIYNEMVKTTICYVIVAHVE